MAKRNPKDPKKTALKEHGTLNPRPEDVSDNLFLEMDFFDACDLLQVKYEMLRRVRVDGTPVVRAARTFGLSRPSFYQAAAAFKRDGLPGLLPVKRGPRRAHKLSAPVMAFIAHKLHEDPSLKAQEMGRLIESEFDIRVHSRSIERALKRGEKKTP
jgi:transposase